MISSRLLTSESDNFRFDESGGCSHSTSASCDCLVLGYKQVVAVCDDTERK